MASKSVKSSPGRWRNSPHSRGRPALAGVYTSCSTSGRRVQMSVPRGRKSRPTWGRAGGRGRGGGRSSRQVGLDRRPQLKRVGTPTWVATRAPAPLTHAFHAATPQLGVPHSDPPQRRLKADTDARGAGERDVRQRACSLHALCRLLSAPTHVRLRSAEEHTVLSVVPSTRNAPAPPARSSCRRTGSPRRPLEAAPGRPSRCLQTRKCPAACSPAAPGGWVAVAQGGPKSVGAAPGRLHKVGTLRQCGPGGQPVGDAALPRHKAGGSLL
jgi:hypothetical protein